MPESTRVEGACCEACGQPKPYGPETEAEAWARWEAEQYAELERKRDPRNLPIFAPEGWDQDLWSEFRSGCIATFRGGPSHA